ncbi:MAG: fasciclin domain-containing protein [Chitinophagaceae bacterium]|nr:fasciclin domain-containing protein [Bacteroidota bacterium]MBP9932134.1 fasciclin domain-containing protein [Chitinophagaceae bacterium]
MNKTFFALIIICLFQFSCQSNSADNSNSGETETSIDAVGQSGVQDDISQKNVVQIAIGSKDHSTLVTAVKAAELVDALSNAGPFTVFAPTNDAFNALPAGTVDDLLKPENKEKLATILQYHVYVGSISAELLQDGQTLGMVDGGNIQVSKKDGKTMINSNAEIIASVPASNGVVHVINTVLLPQ